MQHVGKLVEMGLAAFDELLSGLEDVGGGDRDLCLSCGTRSLRATPTASTAPAHRRFMRLSPNPRLPISGPVLTAPAGAPQPGCASPPVPFGLRSLPEMRSCPSAGNRVTSTAIRRLSRRCRTPQRPDRYSRNHRNRRVILPVLGGWACASVQSPGRGGWFSTPLAAGRTEMGLPPFPSEFGNSPRGPNFPRSRSGRQAFRRTGFAYRHRHPIFSRLVTIAANSAAFSAAA